MVPLMPFFIHFTDMEKTSLDILPKTFVFMEKM